MIKQNQTQLERLRADLEASLEYVSKSPSLEAMEKVRSEHNFRCLNNLLNDAVEHKEDFRAERLRELISGLELSNHITLKSQKSAISHLLGRLDNTISEAAA